MHGVLKRRPKWLEVTLFQTKIISALVLKRDIPGVLLTFQSLYVRNSRFAIACIKLLMGICYLSSYELELS